MALCLFPCRGLCLAGRTHSCSAMAHVVKLNCLWTKVRLGVGKHLPEEGELPEEQLPPGRAGNLFENTGTEC